MEITTKIGINIAVVLASLFLKFPVGIAKTATKVTLVLLAIYEVFALISDCSLTSSQLKNHLLCEYHDSQVQY